ncbi:hypothetical protein [Actinoplanes sp. URMC 104]|uniref:hypothetical protein n=1 Tax=Actinoplanes sp. URMC 104 TaxID=3423409 RepID=UPI003F1A2578
MHTLIRLVAVGAALVAGLAPAGPAAAAVTYDPVTKKGFVGRGDVLKAFGWTDATLRQRADGLVFDHDFWTEDTYSVACGGPAFPVLHHREFGRFELFDAAVTDKGRGSAAGYAGKLTGFWITGPRFGISGTSVAPAKGQPCPRGEGTITTSRLVSTSTGWALAVTSGTDYRRLITKVQ